MAMPSRQPHELIADEMPSLASELHRMWPRAPRASDVEFALQDAQNMVALLSANVEFLAQPRSPETVETVAIDLRASARRLGQLLGVIAVLLRHE
jgi:hypothetical protein